MKRFLLMFFLILFGSTALADSALRDGFQTPPNGAKPEVWWHWTSEDLNKKGMTADLESMKKVGIDRAYIFFTGGAGKGVGLTPERIEFYRFAAAEAKRIGITLGMHNCPGWSSSGGPWITPPFAMKGLVKTETVLTGGKTIKVKLPQPPTRLNFYRDLAVLAVPSKVGPFDPQILLDGKEIRSGSFKLPTTGNNSHSVLECRFDVPVTARNLGIVFSTSSLNVGGYIEAVDENNSARKVGEFRIKKYGWLNHPEPDTWQILYLAEQNGSCATAKRFRIHFLGQEGKQFIVPIARVRFFNNEMIPNVDQKNSSTDRFGYQAPERPTEQGVRPEEILDLTDKMSKDGTLNWTAPKGQFTVLRIGYTALGKMCAPVHQNLRGLECDKLARSGIDEHWKNMMTPILKQAGPYNTIQACLIDSYEMGGQNWTEGLDKIFEKKRGYSMRQYFPAIFGYTIGTAADSAAFLYDFQRTVSDCFVENYYDRFFELCQDAGIMSSCESYNGPFDDLQCAHRIPLPVTEFWVGGGGLGSRYSVSAARIHGHTVNGAEAFTAEPGPGRWQQDPRQLKRYGDKAWIEGVNLLILHSYVQQPYENVRPGMTLMQYGTHFGRNNTWWNDSEAWMKYMARGQFLLQSGHSTSEILILAGESQPNALGIRADLTNAGYDFDYCDAETVHKRLKAQNGKIQIEGALDYDVFFLGKERHPSLATLRKILDLLEKGAFVAGQVPLGSPSLSDKKDQQEYNRIVKTIWTDKKFTNFCSTDSALTALQQAKILPNCSVSNVNFKTIARETENERIYFIVNTSTEESFGRASFRVSGMTPEFWDPINGSIKSVPVWNATRENRTEIPIKLQPNASIFVVFSKKNVEDHPTEIIAGAVQPDSQSGLIVLEAKYRISGDLAGGTDVTERVRKALNDKGLSLVVENNTLGKKDPYPDKFKELYLRCRINGKEKVAVYPEHSQIDIPLIPEGTYIADFNCENGKCNAEFSRTGTFSIRFASGKTRSATCNIPTERIDLSQNWLVEFEKNLGAPNGNIPFTELTSWTKRSEFGIKYFSGSAVYRKHVTLDPKHFQQKKSIKLDLGEVKNLARLTVNGKDLGVLWTPPFAIDITSAVKPGDNLLEIKVVNLWVNRLIGDEFHPTANQQDKPDWVKKGLPNSGDGRYTWASWKGWTKDEQPLESGLLGPVTLEVRPVLIMK